MSVKAPSKGSVHHVKMNLKPEKRRVLWAGKKSGGDDEHASSFGRMTIMCPGHGAKSPLFYLLTFHLLITRCARSLWRKKRDDQDCWRHSELVPPSLDSPGKKDFLKEGGLYSSRWQLKSRQNVHKWMARLCDKSARLSEPVSTNTNNQLDWKLSAQKKFPAYIDLYFSLPIYFGVSSENL